MSAADNDLKRLLAELSRTASPLGRMKLVARAWRTIRRLSPEARATLASSVGIDGAEGLLERLAARSGRLSPVVLQRALEKVRSTDPAELGGMLRGLGKPETRREILDRGRGAVVETLTGPPDPHGGAETVETAPDPRKSPDSDAEPAADRASNTLSTTMGVGLATEPTTEPAAPEPSEEALPDPPPPVIAETPEPAQAPARSVPPVAPVAPVAPVSTVAPVPPSSHDDGVALLERIAREPRLMARFRHLREGIGAARDLDTEALRGLLQAFPAGWSRRRALNSLLVARIPRDAEQALDLIDELESPMGRRWCARTLLRDRRLSTADRHLIERRHPGLILRRKREPLVATPL